MSSHLPCAPVNDVGSALSDPQVTALGMISRTIHPEYGEISNVGSPIRAGGAENGGEPAPRLGEHTDEVLTRLLGYDSDRVASLNKTGAVA